MTLILSVTMETHLVCTADTNGDQMFFFNMLQQGGGSLQRVVWHQMQNPFFENLELNAIQKPITKLK